MKTDIHVSIFDVIIFLGVCQGLFLSWFFLKNFRGEKKSNLYQGLLLISLSLTIFEEWLNNAGFIVRTLYLTNFSESLNFTFAPLFYFYIWFSFNPSSKRKTWPHFILFFIWTILMVFQFVQPDEMKYNSYIQTKHPDWQYLPVNPEISDDPVGVRVYANQLMLVQFIVYTALSFGLVLRKFREVNQSFFKTENDILRSIRNFILNLLILIFIMILTKAYFGIRSDIGTYFVATYVSLMIYNTTYLVIDKSDFFEGAASFMSFPSLKYRKSSLSDPDKEAITKKIRYEMDNGKYFTSNLASLAGLAKQLNESPHHVSQVINEKFNMSFFELLAFYRVEHAKKIIREDREGKMTIEELAETVGYNSKSSFNTAFRKFTSKTPSEFRKLCEES